MKPTSRVWTTSLWAATTVTMSAALWAALIHAPDEKVMGAVQRIFYFHLPSVFATYLALAVMLGGSMGYLWTRRLRWDNLARAANELALLFCTVVLITGSIWARPVWGAWWTWEARITTTLVLWLLLVACLMIRGYAESRDLGARLASIVGIVAVLDVPIIHKAVTWWRGQHPTVFAPGATPDVDPRMRLALLISTLAHFLLFGLLLALRHRQATLEDRAAAIGERLDVGESS